MSKQKPIKAKGEQPAQSASPPVDAPKAAPGVVVDRPLTPEQIAHYLQVSLSSIGRLVKAGDIPFLRVGGKTRFLPSDVIAHYRKVAEKK